MQSWGPSRAAWAATWEMEVGLDVLWHWTFFMALMTSAGPPA